MFWQWYRFAKLKSCIWAHYRNEISAWKIDESSKCKASIIWAYRSFVNTESRVINLMDYPYRSRFQFCLRFILIENRSVFGNFLTALELFIFYCFKDQISLTEISHDCKWVWAPFVYRSDFFIAISFYIEEKLAIQLFIFWVSFV